MKRFKSSFQVLMALLLVFGALGALPIKSVTAISPDLRISQVYGGGGGTYTHDYIEIFNAGTTAVSLAGKSLQYASATGTGNFGANATAITELPDLTLAAGKYYLVQEASGSVGIALPTPDLVDATPISMSGTAGKVALVNSATTLGCNGSSTICSPAQLALIIDLVGYGTANFYEGTAAAPTLSTTTAALRAVGGCTDTDNNGSDFTAVAPAPRNGEVTANSCTVVGDLAPTVASTTPGNNGTASKTDNIVITFSEPVTVADGWINISCSTSGTLTPVVEDADPVYTLNPVADFVGGETCTVTIDHTKVNDDDTDDTTYDYMEADFRFSFTVLPGCGDAYTPIYSIQGSGLSSPLVGTPVTTEGVVVGDFQNNASPDSGNLNGFFIQDPTGDTDNLTSDGIFAYNASVDVQFGDTVLVTGTVVEYEGLTEINPVSQVLICGSGTVPEPVVVTLPLEDPAQLERYEGMLVNFPDSLTIAEYFNYDRFGHIVLTNGRYMTFTAEQEPDVILFAANNLDYSKNKIVLDDGNSAQNPAVLRHPDGTPFTKEHYFRGGDLVSGVTGLLDYYTTDGYRIQPIVGAIYTPSNARETIDDLNLLPGDLKVASFNVLNYFITLDNDPSDTDDDATDSCGPIGGKDCRGADTADELTRQRNKLLDALLDIDADVFGLMEIENDRLTGEGDAVADLVAGLNDVLGVGTYAYIDTGTIGTDAIKQAILYKPGKVTPVGEYKILDSTVDPRFIDVRNRPALAQTFSDMLTGKTFTVAVNHLKSKGSTCDGDPDLLDGADNCNITRRDAALALVDWLADETVFPGSQNTLIIGDLNSYDKEDPIDAIKLGSDDTAGTSDDYLDMIFEVLGDYAYGYVFDGKIGYLDYALANMELAGNVVDVNFWHINADESDVFDYDMSFKPLGQEALYTVDPYRSSDHDPVIITLRFSPEAEDDSYTTDEDTPLDVAAPGVLANDYDTEGDSLIVSLVTPPTNGSLTLNADGSFSYVPALNFSGLDSFVYKAADENYYDIATVSITVNPVNDGPTAVDDAYSVVENGLLEVAAPGVMQNDLEVDTDEMTVVLVSIVSNGSLVLLGDGSFTYQPAPDFFGTDTFVYNLITYPAAIQGMWTDEATVTITVTEEVPVFFNLYLPLIFR